MTSRCGAVYVELGDQPELDVLRRCTIPHNLCRDHPVQLDWVRADPGRTARYDDQVRRYQRGERVGAAITQEVLL